MDFCDDRCKEASAGSLLTCRSDCSFISQYNTMGILPPWSCTWIAFWKNSHFQNIWFGPEFNKCLIAPLRCVHLKKTKTNWISAETNQTLSPKQNNMRQSNVIVGCYAKLIKFVFQIKKKTCNAICNISCRTMLLCKLANIYGLNHNKYTPNEYWNLQYTKMKYYATQNFGSPLDVHRIDA